MSRPFNQWGKALPATTSKPEPTTPGMVVHRYFDISMYMGTAQQIHYLAADTDEDLAKVLADMPLATVKFYQIPDGEAFFNDAD